MKADVIFAVWQLISCADRAVPRLFISAQLPINYPFECDI